jgi:hypothetical protein
MPADSLKQILDRRPWLAHGNLFNHGFAQAAPVDAVEEIAIGVRLLEAYRCACRDMPIRGDEPDIWTSLLGAWYGDFKALLARGSARELTEYLRDLPRQPAAHGYFQGREAYDNLMRDGAGREHRAIALMEYLAGYAEAVGVLAVRSPEQAGWQEFGGDSARALRAAIERKTGVPIAFPPVFDGLFALEPDDGALHLRSIMPAYAIHQLASVRTFVATGERGLRVAEIGAGIGFTAFAAQSLACERYAIFDLPEVNVTQGYFLLRTLGRDKVALYGEPQKDRKVAVLPGFAFHAEPDGSYNVTLNIDSLPEIARADAAHYVASIARCSRSFFSINQETQAPQTNVSRQLKVSELIEENGRFRSVWRYPNWVRPGYVDEFWLVSDRP